MTLLADRWGLHLGRLTLTPEFLFLLSASLTMDSGGITGLFLLSAALHELGHLLCCLLLGVSVWRLRLTCCGGVLETVRVGGCAECLIALAGPAANLLAAAVLSRSGDNQRLAVLLGVNLMLGLFNLLPVLPLDGGRALRWLLGLWLSEEGGAGVMEVLSAALKGVLFLLGCVLFLLGNPSLLVVAAVLMMTAEE